MEIVKFMISLHPIIREVKEAGGDFPELAVKHLRREQNGGAHKLVQLAKRTAHATAWYELMAESTVG